MPGLVHDHKCVVVQCFNVFFSRLRHLLPDELMLRFLFELIMYGNQDTKFEMRSGLCRPFCLVAD